MFFYWGCWKWGQPVCASAEGVALLVAGKYIENSAVSARDAWSDCPGWGYSCTAVFQSVVVPLEESWGTSGVSNLKTIHTSKCLQDQTHRGKGIQTYVSVSRVQWTAVAAVSPYGLSTSCSAENKVVLGAFWVHRLRSHCGCSGADTLAGWGPATGVPPQHSRAISTPPWCRVSSENSLSPASLS